MALNVKFLKGSQAQFNSYVEASKLDPSTFYYIDNKDLYLGSIKLSNGEDLVAAVRGIVGNYGEGVTPTTIYALEEAIKALGVPSDKTVQDLIDEAIADIPRGSYYDVTALSDVTNPVEGDVAIVTETKDGIEYRTAYHYAAVEDGFAWKAMSGNYKASDVYIDSAITLAGDFGSIYDTADKKYYPITTIGNKKMGDVFAAGTSMQTILMDILTKRIQPSITANPSASISATGYDGSYEVGTSYTKPTATLTVKTGSYTNEGTSTGVKYEAGNVVLAYGTTTEGDSVIKTTSTAELTDGGSISLAASSYSSDATTALYTDSTVNYTFSGKVTHTAGIVAKDNLGANSDPEVKIAAGSPTVSNKTVGFRGFRKMFVGCPTGDLSSSVIRAFTLKSEKASTTAFEVTAPIGATKLVIAAPTSSCGKNYTLSKAEMMTMSYEDYTSKFTTDAQVDVADAQAGGDKNMQKYNIYSYSFAPLQAATKFRITLK